MASWWAKEPHGSVKTGIHQLTSDGPGSQRLLGNAGDISMWYPSGHFAKQWKI